MLQIKDLKIMFKSILDEFKEFSRFLKEQDIYAYSYYIKEAFQDVYKREMFLKPRSFETFTCYTGDLYDGERKTYLFSYDEFMIRRIIKYGSDSFVSLLKVRDAWYCDSKRKLIYNIDWVTLEELWLIHMLENRKKFNEFSVQNAFMILVRNYNYKSRDLVSLWQEKRK